MSQKQVLIIGGGYGGLATAALFAKRGYTVTVVEKNRQLGGRVGQLRRKGFRFDTGPSWYLMPEVFEDFYKLFSIDAGEELRLTRLTPGYKVFFESQPPLVIQGDLEKDARTFEAIETGAGQALRQYVAQSTTIYRVSVNDILYSTYRSLRWALKKSLLRAVPQFGPLAFIPLHTHTSRSFSDSRLTRILEYHTVFLGTSPYEAPAIYSLMSTLDFGSGVYFPKNGMYSLVESMVRLGKSHGVKFVTGTGVRRVTVKNGEASGVLLEDGTKLTADILISNADLHHTETQLVPKQYQSYNATYWRKRQPGPSALLISLGIRGTLQGLEHHNLYFVDDWKENFASIYRDHTIPKNASLYICNPNKTDPTAAPDGTENLFILLPLPSGKKLSKAQTDSLVDRCLAVVSRLTNAPDLSKRILTRDITTPQLFSERFNAWQYNALGGQSHLLKQSAIFRTGNRSKKLKNLYYVGAGTNPGIGLPMCLISAELVYKLVHNIPTSGPLKSVEGEA